MTATSKRLPSTITVHVPLKLTHRGGRKTIMRQMPRLLPAVTRQRVDDPIIKAIARAYRWRPLIEDGTYASITELAKAKGVNQSYACRVLRLTLLAPNIIEGILDGRISNLSLAPLVKPLSATWDIQMTLLEIDRQRINRPCLNDSVGS